MIQLEMHLDLKQIFEFYIMRSTQFLSLKQPFLTNNNRQLMPVIKIPIS